MKNYYAIKNSRGLYWTATSVYNKVGWSESLDNAIKYRKRGTALNIYLRWDGTPGFEKNVEVVKLEQQYVIVEKENVSTDRLLNDKAKMSLIRKKESLIELKRQATAGQRYYIERINEIDVEIQKLSGVSK